MCACVHVSYAHHAISCSFAHGLHGLTPLPHCSTAPPPPPCSIAAFIEFVDRLMSKQEDDFFSVARVTAKDVAQQVGRARVQWLECNLSDSRVTAKDVAQQAGRAHKRPSLLSQYLACCDRAKDVAQQVGRAQHKRL